MSIVSVYCTFADAQEAERVGRQVVEERLAACVNILGHVQSVYRWKGEVETADEVAAILKTSEDRVPDLVARIAALHSYEVPAIAVWPVRESLPAYEQWIKASVAR